jgi:hypothetical protein
MIKGDPMRFPSSLLALGLLFSSLASAELQNFETLVNKRNNSVKATVMVVKNGVPNAITFHKDNRILAMVSVAPTKELIDITIGEVYEMRAPIEEGDVCAGLVGKLSFIGNDIKIEATTEDNGTAFKDCEAYQINGLYKSQEK